MREEKSGPRRKIIPEKTPMKEQDPKERARNFREVALGYSEDDALREAGRCLNCKDPKCVKGCPVEVPIPEFIELLKEGDYVGAISKIKNKNLLPAVCGRVCPQEEQCEKNCLLGKKNDPVGIGRLERYAADRELKDRKMSSPKPAEKTGKRVAVIGSGPAGLTCAYHLALMGDEVTIFEALHERGVLVYGIPEFRLPKSIVAAEIDALRKLGVKIEMNFVVGRLKDLGELMLDFDACFVGTGAGFPKFFGLDGEHLNGVYSANEFLTRANLMKAYTFPENDTPIKRDRRVAVIGGGNVAMDSVRTALRLGAEEAIIVYRRSMNEMPARKEEIHHAQEEGVRFELCINPVRIIGTNGHVEALECQRMDLCELDSSGRRKPKPIEGSEYQIPVDAVIFAVGTEANPIISQSEEYLKVTDRGYIEADPETGKTSMDGVFAGGDIVTGSATVISAMGAGRKAASAINEYLKTKTSIRVRKIG